MEVWRGREQGLTFDTMNVETEKFPVLPFSCFALFLSCLVLSFACMQMTSIRTRRSFDQLLLSYLICFLMEILDHLLGIVGMLMGGGCIHITIFF
jgi:hypothetical protein